MNLKDLRLKIDEIDNQLIRLILERMKLAKKIGIRKDSARIKIRDIKREEEILNKVNKMANKAGINSKRFVKIWKILISEAKKIQITK